MQRYVRRFLRSAAVRWRVRQGAKNLRAANLEGLDLSGEGFDRVDLRDASLRQADLTGAYLRAAKLGGADLRSTRYDRGTRWPKGFDPRRHGAVRVR